ncbi:hypothetical protein F4776DRAFT_658878 [Hypoxylon sp. NC0597]|nr:hypothetical protein F4776DRAFT_658878 [Hypoxylon sp. NC0597]
MALHLPRIWNKLQPSTSDEIFQHPAEVSVLVGFTIIQVSYRQPSKLRIEDTLRMAATVALAAPAPTGFSPIIDRQSMDAPTPSEVFQATVNISTNVNSNVGFLMLTDTRIDVIGRGIQQFTLDELAVLTLIQDDLANAGENTIVKKISRVLGKYDDIIGNFRQPPAKVKKIQIPDDPSTCNKPRNFCSK